MNVGKYKGKPRESSLDLVRKWFKKNPGTLSADCVRGTGLTRPTVDRCINYIQTQEDDK